jgi:hypothetical protein
MLTLEAVAHFGTAKNLARNLNACSHQAISQWGECPPYLRQCEIELLTGGVLKREPEVKTLNQSNVPPCIHHHPETKVS